MCVFLHALLAACLPPCAGSRSLTAQTETAHQALFSFTAVFGAFMDYISTDIFEFIFIAFPFVFFTVFYLCSISFPLLLSFILVNIVLLSYVLPF